MTDLSILIPARNEEFLAKTIEDILENIEGDTEIIAVMDGYWAEPSVPQNEHVTVVHIPESIGQRAGTNLAAKLSKAKYLMKCDAHCSFDKGFDVKMLEAIKGHDDWTMAPLMKNLHAFDWVCPDGHRRYQGPSGPCKEKLPNGKECGKETVKDVVWEAKRSPNSVSYCFDSTPHFQYFGEFSKRPEGQGDITESMSLQGSCFMLTREKYWELGICDEDFGSWGSQGIEVACKTWLSGGKVMINHKTWYSHMFRTQGGDFSFPYPISGHDQEKAKSHAKDLFFNNRWPKQVHPLSWLIEKFWPIKGWTNEDLQKLKGTSYKFKTTGTSIITERLDGEPLEGIIFIDKAPSKGIIFYTDNEAPKDIAEAVIDNLKKVALDKSLPIVTSSLRRKLHFGNDNIYFPSLRRGMLSQFKQILAALEHSTSEIIFFCEADILYHPSHFDFVPPREEAYYYNINVWKVRWSDGHALKVDNLKQLSGFVGYRDFLIRHYKKRIEVVEKRIKDLEATGKPIENQGVSHYMGYEPGMESRPRGVDNYPAISFSSSFPNIDIRHNHNISKNRWKKEDFQDQKYTKGWTEAKANDIPGWEGFYTKLKNQYPSEIGMIYYSDCTLDEKIAQPVRDQLQKISEEKDIPIVSSTLKKMDFGIENIHFPSLKKGYPAMFKQIVAALEHSNSKIIFFCEHDVLYNPTHFDFRPSDENTFYYNQNVWFLRTIDGHALHYDVNQLSGLCGFREQLLTHFRERYELVMKEGFSRKMGFEPMTHNRIKWKNMYHLGTWKSRHPNIDIRHPGNLTGQRWHKNQFRNKKLLINWQETDLEIPGWGKTSKLVERFS